MLEKKIRYCLFLFKVPTSSGFVVIYEVWRIIKVINAHKKIAKPAIKSHPLVNSIMFSLCAYKKKFGIDPTKPSTIKGKHKNNKHEGDLFFSLSPFEVEAFSLITLLSLNHNKGH